MKRLFLAAATAAVLLLPACVQQQMQKIAYNSKVVVLDIGHYYEPTRGGQGARTPDARYGVIEETDFWYRYAGEVKKTVEAAGYTCRICNRGDVPTNRKLAAAAEKAGVQAGAPKEIPRQKINGIFLRCTHILYSMCAKEGTP